MATLVFSSVAAAIKPRAFFISSLYSVQPESASCSILLGGQLLHQENRRKKVIKMDRYSNWNVTQKIKNNLAAEKLLSGSRRSTLINRKLVRIAAAAT